MSGLELFGLILGVFIIVFCISLVVSKRKGVPRPAYDERQLLLRSRAYRSAFWGLIVYLCLNGFGLAAGFVWADAMTSFFVGICLAVTVFVVICIKNDAYFPVNQQPKFYFGLFGFIMVVNLAAGLIRLLNQNTSFFTDGALNRNILPFVIFLTFASVLAALLIRRFKAKSQAERVEP